ncbi:radical SAM protein [bacterium]|nr:radical SAM protein [bacterium]
MMVDIKILRERRDMAYSYLESCRLCPRECGANRLKGEKGICGVDVRLWVSSYGPHYGEEPPLSGNSGSGTIFFTYCNLKCVYCQNYTISQLGDGDIVSEEDLANMMLYLQRLGCHNINLVTPTHFVPQILSALVMAVEKGLSIPIVYNTSGYEKLETLKLLDGIVDIYLPDMRYSSSVYAVKYSSAPRYPDVNRLAVREMFRQVGNLVLDERGIAKKGLIIRHLVMPEDISGTESVLKFIAEEISKDTYISLMAQYRPEYKAQDFPPLNRRITREEYKRAIEIAKNLGLRNVWTQMVL